MSRFSPKKLVPTPEAIKASKSLRFLGDLIHDPNLFHLNRRSVSRAAFWGILIGLLPPIPIHTPAAAAAALFGRCNLPLVLAIVWISNPVTIPIIAYELYQLGCLVLHITPVSTLELSWNMFYQIWRPYLVGSALGSVSAALLGYFACNYLWRLNVKRKWKARSKLREARRDSAI
ncbi:MAG TPA: DUF2062 domain-containing protein [Cellvibrio sp.]|nr:DUF2062 domain-containing protein [Cellvibrio sp.]